LTTQVLPVIGVVNEIHSYAKLVSLIADFVKDDYRAIGLTVDQETNAADFMYKLEWHTTEQIDIPALIKMYYNFALPDIIFLHMRLEDLMMLPEKLTADIILKPSSDKSMNYTNWDDKYILDIDSNGLLVCIKKLLQ